MEKMLDKKSRDFAKNMRDTMLYDKDKNEVQIGTNLYVDGNFTADSIIENMNGYQIINVASEINLIYGGACKNGNKITFVLFGDLYAETLPSTGFWRICAFKIPTEVGQKLFPYSQSGFDNLLNKTIVNLSTGVSVGANVNVSCIV